MTTTISNKNKIQTLRVNEKENLISSKLKDEWDYEKSIEKKNSALCETSIGFSLGLLASTIFTINGIIVQYFELDAVDTVTVRSIFQITLLGIILKIRSKNIGIQIYR